MKIGGTQIFIICLLGEFSDRAHLNCLDKVDAQQMFKTHSHPKSSCLSFETNGSNYLTISLSGRTKWF